MSVFVFDDVAAHVGFCFFADAVGEQLTDAVNVVIHQVWGVHFGYGGILFGCVAMVCIMAHD